MATGVALGVTFTLFGGMQALVAIGRASVSEGTTHRVIEFVRLKRNSNLELKERRLPDRHRPLVLRPRRRQVPWPRVPCFWLDTV